MADTYFSSAAQNLKKALNFLFLTILNRFQFGAMLSKAKALRSHTRSVALHEKATDKGVEY
jgi:hypothetical protein